MRAWVPCADGDGDGDGRGADPGVTEKHATKAKQEEEMRFAKEGRKQQSRPTEPRTNTVGTT